MRLPDFIGLGGQRCGSTWLDVQLRHHPDLFLPENEKELHFFDRYYERGLAWYAGWFDSPRAAQCVAGEITPGYLYFTEAPERIRRDVGEPRFIVLMRDPVSRAVSHFRFAKRIAKRNPDFEETIRTIPAMTKYGRYSRFLEAYLRLFPRDRFHIMLYEDVHADPRRHIEDICRFLGVDPALYPQVDLSEKIYSAKPARSPMMMAAAMRTKAAMRRAHLDGAVRFLRDSGINRLFQKSDGKSDRRVSAIPERLLDAREEEIENLRSLLGIDASVWRRADG